MNFKFWKKPKKQMRGEKIDFIIDDDPITKINDGLETIAPVDYSDDVALEKWNRHKPYVTDLDEIKYRCKGLLKSGKRCSRQTSFSYCWQHSQKKELL